MHLKETCASLPMRHRKRKVGRGCKTLYFCSMNTLPKKLSYCIESGAYVRISASYFLRTIPIVSLLSAPILLGASAASHSVASAPNSVLASLAGVHHLGPDYLINRFYVNQSIGDNIDEGGGGGSRVCCMTLPRQWRPSISVDVRWKVHHIIRSADPKRPDTEEIEGIYQAQVPVEEYAEPGDLFVHFFPNGRVRVVVSGFASNSERHPIREEDTKARQTAVRGRAIKALFTEQELAEGLKKIEDDRRKYGDWR